MILSKEELRIIKRDLYLMVAKYELDIRYYSALERLYDTCPNCGGNCMANALIDSIAIMMVIKRTENPARNFNAIYN